MKRKVPVPFCVRERSDLCVPTRNRSRCMRAIFIPVKSAEEDDSSPEDNKKSLIVTTVGKIIFNEIFPDDVPVHQRSDESELG